MQLVASALFPTNRKARAALTIYTFFLMKQPAHELADQLLAVLTPYGKRQSAGGLLPKAVAKPLRRLVKALAKAQTKADAAARPAPPPTHKKERTALAAEVTARLRPLLAGAGKTDEAPKPVAKSVKRLAAELVKQRRKQAKQAQKSPRKTGEGRPESAVAGPSTPSRPKSASRPAGPVRRPTAPKATPAQPVAPPAKRAPAPRTANKPSPKSSDTAAG